MKKAVLFRSIALGIVVFAGGTGCRRRVDAVAQNLAVIKPNQGLTNLSTSYDEARTKAGHDGMPLSASELTTPSVPDAENAGTVYKQIVESLTTNPVADTSILLHLNGWRMPSAGQIAAARDELALHSDVLALIHKAAKLPKCHFDRDYSLGADLLYPEWGKMNNGVRMLSAESTLMLTDGETLDAIANYALLFAIARHAASEPDVVCNETAIVYDRLALYGLEKILYKTGEQPDIAEAVEKCVTANWQPHDLKYGLGTSIGIFDVAIDGIRTGTITDDSELKTAYKQRQQSGTTQNWEAYGDANVAYILDVVRLMRDAAGRPSYQSMLVMRNLESAVRSDSNSANLLAKTMISNYRKAVLKQADNQARADVVRAAASVLAWRQTHGSFPKSLDEAMTKVPADPYDGSPLQYRLVGNSGFVIWSVGPTGVFDGGSPYTRPDKSETYFMYPLPSFAGK